MVFDGAIERVMGRLNTQFYALMDEIKQIRDYLGELVEIAKQMRDSEEVPVHKKYRRDISE